MYTGSVRVAVAAGLGMACGACTLLIGTSDLASLAGPDAAAESAVPVEATDAQPASDAIADVSDASADALGRVNVGLVARYGGSGVDLSGHGRPATAVDVALAADRFGNANVAASFTGSGYLEVVGHSGLPVGSAERTVSLWLKTSVTTSASFLNWGTASGTGTRFGLTATPDTDYFVGENADVTGTKKINDGAWHNIVVTFDGNQVLTIYVDNDFSAANARPLDTKGNDLEIGRTAVDHVPEPYTGLVDDVRIYDRVLNGSERALIYLEGGWPN
jgi:hypothetical protein